MVQKIAFLFFFALNIPSNGLAQEPIIGEKINEKNITATTFLGFDNQKNAYSLQENVLSKSTAFNTFEFKRVSLGKITHVDFQNPLQIVVFYDDFNTVILLDNQLNETKKIDFNLLEEVVNIDAVALSSQNRLWLFDGISSKIGLYNYTNDSYKWISTPIENPVKQYHANYTHLYWINDQNRLNAISIYGTISSFGQFPNFEKVQIMSDQRALYLYQNQLFYYDTANKRSTEIKISEKFVTDFFFTDGILAIFTQNKITNYKIILP